MSRPGASTKPFAIPVSRRHLLRLSIAAGLAGYMGTRAGMSVVAASSVAAGPGMGSGIGGTSSGRVLFRSAAIADGRTSMRRVGQSILVENGRIAWIRPTDSEPDPGPASGLEVVNASGLTAVPGLVDAHCHLTSPGGPRYMEHFHDSPAEMLETADRNGALARGAGTAWLREVGSPTVTDPVDGRRRALALGIRDRWRGRRDRPRVRSGGTWIAPPGVMDSGLAIVARNGDELLAAANRQLDLGADIVKLYVQAKNSNESPWTAAQIRRVSDAVHARGAIVTAHAMHVGPAKAATFGGVDAIEHGFRLSDEVCAEMARRGTFLVTTLIVPRAWLTFGSAAGTFWATRAGKRYAQRTKARADDSARIARRAGVKICAGTDFGGGGPRAGQLAWEVESLVAIGMQPWQALGSATWRGGSLIGDPEAGRMREGGPADFFLVDGNPYDDPSALWNVRRLA